MSPANIFNPPDIEGVEVRRLRSEPTRAQLEGWMDEGGCEATDGCWVEPDGTCPHGSPSWLIKLGLI